METAILVLHVVVSLGLIGLVVLQQGKGADMGAAFGSGASSTVFGASGSANFLSRTTAVLAAVFFLTSMSLTFFAAKGHGQTSRPAAQQSQPVAPQPVAPVVPQGDSDKSGAIPK